MLEQNLDQLEAWAAGGYTGRLEVTASLPASVQVAGYRAVGGHPERIPRRELRQVVAVFRRDADGKGGHLLTLYPDAPTSPPSTAKGVL